MPATYSAGEIASMITRMAKMDVAELGNDATGQKQYIYYYMTLAQWRFAALAFVVRVSDVLTVSSDGYVTFQRGGTAIDDLYEQLRILDAAPASPTFGQDVAKRSSFSAPKGWWRESSNTQLHIKGTGTYTMHYKAYPTKVTIDTQQLEWPATSYDLLMWQTIGMIKESKNDATGAAAAYAVVDKLIPILVKSQIDAQGVSGGRPPSQNDVQYYRR